MKEIVYPFAIGCLTTLFFGISNHLHAQGGVINDDKPGGGIVIEADRPSKPDKPEKPNASERGNPNAGTRDPGSNNPNAVKTSPPAAPVETTLQRQERQIKELAARKVQKYKSEAGLWSVVISDKKLLERFTQEATLEILERDRIQQEKDVQAEKIRVEQDRVNREKKAREELENRGNHH